MPIDMQTMRHKNRAHWLSLPFTEAIAKFMSWRLFGAIHIEMRRVSTRNVNFKEIQWIAIGIPFELNGGEIRAIWCEAIERVRMRWGTIGAKNWIALHINQPIFSPNLDF